MKKTIRIAVVVGAMTLSLAACGERDSGDDAANNRRTDGASPSSTESATTETTAAPAREFKACMVSDSGGFDDKSFNQTALKGQDDAVAALGIESAKAPSAGDAEYADNINKLLGAGCNEITTVGYKLGDATLAAAKKNKDVDFAIVDFAYADDKGNNTSPKNLKGLVYDTKSASYLAGYLAAAKSKSGKVGTFGGLPLVTVTDFMEGFRQGIERFNADNDADVQLLGWDGKDGQFTQDFEDSAKGQQVGEQLVQQGADVIFPVAGPAGLGGLQAAKDGGVKAIWVDTDGCVSVEEFCDILLTSVQKGLDVSVNDAIKASYDDTFNNDLYVGTLENNGVGLAPLSGDVDDELAGKIDELKAGLIDGSIKLK